MKRSADLLGSSAWCDVQTVFSGIVHVRTHGHLKIEFCVVAVISLQTPNATLSLPIHSVYLLYCAHCVYNANMLLIRVLTTRAFLAFSIGVFVLIELWTLSPPSSFAEDDNNRDEPNKNDMKEQEYDPLWQFVPADSKEIRKWGCNRTETPLIFVHIGTYKVPFGVCFSRHTRFQFF